MACKFGNYFLSLHLIKPIEMDSNKQGETIESKDSVTL
jgi:hypothetical protein